MAKTQWYPNARAKRRWLLADGSTAVDPELEESGSQRSFRIQGATKASDSVTKSGIDGLIQQEVMRQAVERGTQVLCAIPEDIGEFVGQALTKLSVDRSGVNGTSPSLFFLDAEGGLVGSASRIQSSVAWWLLKTPDGAAVVLFSKIRAERDSWYSTGTTKYTVETGCFSLGMMFSDLLRPYDEASLCDEMNYAYSRDPEVRVFGHERSAFEGDLDAATMHFLQMANRTSSLIERGSLSLPIRLTTPKPIKPEALELELVRSNITPEGIEALIDTSMRKKDLNEALDHYREMSKSLSRAGISMGNLESKDLVALMSGKEDALKMPVLSKKVSASVPKGSEDQHNAFSTHSLYVDLVTGVFHTSCSVQMLSREALEEGANAWLEAQAIASITGSTEQLEQFTLAKIREAEDARVRENNKTVRQRLARTAKLLKFT